MSLLVIVSTDYGELSIAKYFLEGLAATPMPVMLVPAELRQQDGVEADVDVRTYRGWRTCVAWWRRCDPIRCFSSPDTC